MAKKNPSVLTALCNAVAAYYQKQGDKSKAGVQVACISHDPPRYYCAIHRYLYGAETRQIVVNTKGDFDSVEAAVLDVAKRWRAMVEPPVKDTLEVLSTALTTGEG